MIETSAIVAIGAGAVILVTSTIAALGIIFSPTFATSPEKHGIDEKEFQERLKQNNDLVQSYSSFGVYPRSFSSRSSVKL